MAKFYDKTMEFPKDISKISTNNLGEKKMFENFDKNFKK